MREARRFPAGPRATLGANLGFLYFYLGPPDRSWVPRDLLKAFRTDFGAISDPLGRPWKPKNTVKYSVFAVFHVAPQRTSRSFKSALGGSQNDPQEAPRSGPARPRRPPRRFQERHKRPKSAPRAPKHGFRAALAAKLGPTGTKEPPGGLPKAILELRGPVLHPPGGRFSDSFLLSESIAKAVQWAKLAQAYAQHRFTSLCNFYMWISTATDSKSRSTDPCANSSLSRAGSVKFLST